MQHEVLQRHNFGRLPSSKTSVVGDLQHVIGEVLSEHQIVSLWLWVELVRGGEPRRQLRVLLGREGDRLIRNSLNFRPLFILDAVIRP